ncbi:MAG TPA: FkbM family methyltransferase [Pirellulales bacterium]|nr:FkbM family methyltransferase [Pirellulales bacterium]
MPRKFGGRTIFVTPSAALAFWYKPLAVIGGPLLERLAEVVKPGDCVWDVGANVGLASFTAAALAGPTGRVLAIEPDPFLVGLLEKSAARRCDSSAPVDVLALAVADADGLVQFCQATRSRSSNHLAGYGESQTGGMLSTRWVPAKTLDSLLEYFPPPRILKIDVEGAEKLVLAGACKVLSEHHPVVICEVSARFSRCVSDQLRGFGYTLYDLEVSPAARTPLETAAPDIIAFPPAWQARPVS